MRRLVIVATALVLVLNASSATAGRLFGDIKMDGKPVAEGLKLTITAPLPAEAAKGEAGKAPAGKTEAGKADAPKPKTAAAIADSAVTDKFGSYKLTVKEAGKCILTLLYEKQPVTLEVFSYKDATRYDLVLEKKDGKLSLRRK